MLINSQDKGIYERILTAKNGQLVRVTFAVVEVNGVMRGRIISVAPVVSVAGQTVVATTTANSATEQLYLPLSVHHDIAASVESIFVKKTPSPYLSFEFFMSQPTRAPSFK
jgi:hypothetical protein